MTHLRFAQLSDIHISDEGDLYGVLGSQAPHLLRETVTHLNNLNLDFVLITGDLLDNALAAEFDLFHAAIAELTAPYYVIPGNHDRRDLDADLGLTRHSFAARFNPQIADRPTDDSSAQVGYWSLEIAPDLQLIGLDSIRDADWGGVIDEMQMAWLTQELYTHRDKLVIVAVHHPLHPLAPIDDEPKWQNFVCDNGAEVMALLDRHPQVKLLLTGHHHLTKADWMGQRLHLACPALAIYPCAYRLLTLSQVGEGWHLTWETLPAADKATQQQAREKMIDAWRGADIEESVIETHIEIAHGQKLEDRAEEATW